MAEGLDQVHKDDLHVAAPPEELDDLLPIEGNGRWRLKLTPLDHGEDPGETGLVWISAAVAAHHSYGFFDIHTRGAMTWLVPVLAAAGSAAITAAIGSRQIRQLHRRIDFLVSASAFTVLRLEPSAREQELQEHEELVEQARAAAATCRLASGRTLPW